VIAEYGERIEKSDGLLSRKNRDKRLDEKQLDSLRGQGVYDRRSDELGIINQLLQNLAGILTDILPHKSPKKNASTTNHYLSIT